jgi:trehalose-6-phosphate synthase
MESLFQAIQMPAEERRRRALALAESIQREDLNHWITSQLQDIGELV